MEISRSRLDVVLGTCGQGLGQMDPELLSTSAILCLCNMKMPWFVEAHARGPSQQSWVG